MWKTIHHKGVSKHVGYFYGESPDNLDEWFEENKDTYEPPEVDWDSPKMFDVDMRAELEIMVRSSGLTKEEFIKRICEEDND